ALHRCLDLIQALVVLHNGLIDLDACGVREVFEQRRAHVGHIRPEQIDDLFAAGCWMAATRTQQTARQGYTAGGPYDAQEGTTAEMASLRGGTHGLCSCAIHARFHRRPTTIDQFVLLSPFSRDHHFVLFEATFTRVRLLR